MSPIRVVVVDDHAIVRDGIVGVFAASAGFQVVGVAGDGWEALSVTARTEPDVVLMDLRMPGLDGVETIKELRRRGPRPRVVVLTTFDADDAVLPAIDAGADGYLLKDTSAAELMRAVRDAHEGRPAIVSEVAAALIRRAQAPPSPTLSDREAQVLHLVADGATSKEIGDRLYISETTVKTHLAHIFAKLDVRDRAAAVHVAHRRGLL